MTALNVLMAWVLLGAIGVGIEHGGSIGDAKRSGGDTPEARRRVTRRLIAYGPVGWFLLACCHALPRWVKNH